MTEEEKKIEQSLMPWRFWFFVSISALLGIVFIWVLPDLFVNHSGHGAMSATQNAPSTQSMQNMPGMNMPGMVMGPTVNAEQKDVTQGPNVTFFLTPPEPQTGSTTRMDFFVNNKPDNSPIANLMLMHDKYVHVIGVRDDMEGFFHIHPESVTDKTYSKPLETLPAGWKIVEEKLDGVGVYMIYPPAWERMVQVLSVLRLQIIDAYDNGRLDEGEAIIETEIIDNSQKLSLDQVINGRITEDQIESKRNVTIGGQSSEQIKYIASSPESGAKSRGIGMYVPYGNRIVSFTLIYRENDPKESELIQDFVSMMDSVAFAELEIQKPGYWTVEHVFDKPGRYKLWSQMATLDGTDHIFGEQPFTVSGSGPTSQKNVAYDKIKVADGYQVTLDYGVLAKGQAMGLGISIKDSAGKEVQVEPYLAADMHMAIIKDDWTQFIHTHPAAPQNLQAAVLDWHIIPEAFADGIHVTTPLSYIPKGSLQFAVIFPTSGVYKVFAQFRPKGTDLPKDEALTASFWVKVDESIPFTIGGNRALNATISLILIALLSLTVKKFLEPRKS